ncbi:MAG: hypothetical protein ACLRR3_01295 [Eubacterium sp.]
MASIIEVITWTIFYPKYGLHGHPSVLKGHQQKNNQYIITKKQQDKLLALKDWQKLPDKQEALTKLSCINAKMTPKTEPPLFPFFFLSFPETFPDSEEYP